MSDFIGYEIIRVKESAVSTFGKPMATRKFWEF